MAHYKMVKRILDYINGTVDLGFHFNSQSTLDLYTFLDADWQAILKLEALPLDIVFS